MHASRQTSLIFVIGNTGFKEHHTMQNKPIYIAGGNIFILHKQDAETRKLAPTMFAYPML